VKAQSNVYHNARKLMTSQLSQSQGKKQKTKNELKIKTY